MFDHKTRAIALLCLFGLLVTPMLASAQSDMINTHKPLTLKVRYGANADPANVAAAGSGDKSRRIELQVAKLDAGRVETRDAILEYRVDATGDAGDVGVSLDLTFAVSEGQQHMRSQMLLPRREWMRVEDSSDSAAGTSAVFVRIDPN